VLALGELDRGVGHGAAATAVFVGKLGHPLGLIPTAFRVARPVNWPATLL